MSIYDDILAPDYTSVVKKRNYDDLLSEAADYHGIPAELPVLQKILKIESGGDPNAKSPKGASGLMQLMPDTAKSVGVKNINDPKENIFGGVKYYRDMLNKFGGDRELALAAYNAGPGAVERHKGIPPYQETQKYVKNIMQSIGNDIKPKRETANASPDVFQNTIGTIEQHGVTYGSGKNKNVFGDEWKEDNCGGFTTMMVNRGLKSLGVNDNLLPTSNLGTEQPKYLAEKFGSELVGGKKFTPQTLYDLGEGAVIAGTKPDGVTHAEIIVRHPNTGELVVASYGVKGKTVQYKPINEEYTAKLNSGKFQATNPFSVLSPDTGNMFAGPGAKSSKYDEILAPNYLKKQEQINKIAPSRYDEILAPDFLNPKIELPTIGADVLGQEPVIPDRGQPADILALLQKTRRVEPGMAVNESMAPPPQGLAQGGYTPQTELPASMEALNRVREQLTQERPAPEIDRMIDQTQRMSTDRGAIKVLGGGQIVDAYGKVVPQLEGQKLPQISPLPEGIGRTKPPVNVPYSIEGLNPLAGIMNVAQGARDIGEKVIFGATLNQSKDYIKPEIKKAMVASGINVPETAVGLNILTNFVGMTFPIVQSVNLAKMAVGALFPLAVNTFATRMATTGLGGYFFGTAADVNQRLLGNKPLDIFDTLVKEAPYTALEFMIFHAGTEGFLKAWSALKNPNLSIKNIASSDTYKNAMHDIRLGFYRMNPTLRNISDGEILEFLNKNPELWASAVKDVPRVKELRMKMETDVYDAAQKEARRQPVALLPAPEDLVANAEEAAKIATDKAKEVKPKPLAAERPTKPTYRAGPTPETAVRKPVEVKEQAATPVPEAKGKEPWEMTQKEYLDYRRKDTGKLSAILPKEDILEFHKEKVRDALYYKIPVHPEVLKDYPDLVSKYGKGGDKVESVATTIAKQMGTTPEEYIKSQKENAIKYHEETIAQGGKIGGGLTDEPWRRVQRVKEAKKAIAELKKDEVNPETIPVEGKVETKIKEPWQLTKEEYENQLRNARMYVYDEFKKYEKIYTGSKKKLLSPYQTNLEEATKKLLDSKLGHYDQVRYALERGDNVPNHVIDQYPDLRNAKPIYDKIRDEKSESKAEPKPEPKAEAQGEGVTIPEDETAEPIKKITLTPEEWARQNVPNVDTHIRNLGGMFFNTPDFIKSEFYDGTFPVPKEGGLGAALNTKKYETDKNYQAKIDKALQEVEKSILDANRIRLMMIEDAGGIEAYRLVNPPDMPEMTGQKGVRATYGADIQRMWNVSARNKYNENMLGNISIRESLQNSLDAVMEAIEKGEIKKGQISITPTDVDEWNDDKYKGFVVEDNGIGMSDEEIGSKFLALYGTGKDKQGRFGGFGLAKAVILMPSESAKWSIWTRDNYFDAGMAGRVDNVGQTKLRQGTVIKIESDESIINHRAEMFVATTNPPKNVVIKYNGKILEDPFKGFRAKNVGNVDITDDTKYSMTYYHNAPDLFVGRVVYRLVDDKTGAKLTQGIETEGGDFIGCLVVDVTTNATPGGYDYPFIDNRESLKYGSWREPINKFIQRTTQDKRTAGRNEDKPPKWELAQRLPGWKNLWPKLKNDPQWAAMKKLAADSGVVTSFNMEDDGLAHAKISGSYKGKYFASPFIAKYMLAMDISASLTSKAINANYNSMYMLFENPLEDGGVILAEYNGSQLGINPTTIDSNVFASPIQLAMYIRSTVNHELTHQWYGRHNEDYSSGREKTSRTTHEVFPKILELAEMVLGSKETQIGIGRQTRENITKYLPREQLELFETERNRNYGDETLFYPIGQNGKRQLGLFPERVDRGTLKRVGLGRNAPIGVAAKQQVRRKPEKSSQASMELGGAVKQEGIAFGEDKTRLLISDPTGVSKVGGGKGSLAFAPQKGFRPTPATGTAAEKPIGRKEMVDFLRQALNQPIRTGRFFKGGRQSGVLGKYWIKNEMIRTRFANDPETTAHEVFHAIHKHLFPWARTPKGNLSAAAFSARAGVNNTMRKELAALAYPGAKGKLIEGFAEFGRYYITEPSKAQAKAPEFLKYYDNLLKDKAPDLHSILIQARDNYTKWMALTPQQRIRAQMSSGEPSKKSAMSWSSFYANFVDELNPIRKSVRQMIAPGEKLDYSKDPYILARLLPGVTGKGDTFALYKTFDYNTLQWNGKGLKEILEPIKEKLQDFEDYAIARRANELHKRKIETGLIPSDTKTIQTKYDQEFGPIFDELQGYQDRVLQYLKDGGLLNQETYLKIKSLNKDYVPFYRLLQDIEGTPGGLKGLESKIPIKKIKGSWLNIINPLESILKNTYSYIQLADRNGMLKALVDLAESREGMGNLVERIPAQKAMVAKVKLSDVLSKDELESLDIQDEDLLDRMTPIFKQSMFAPKGNVITVFEQGKPSYFEVSPELYRAISGMDKVTLNISNAMMAKIDKAFRFPAKLLRAGATLSLEFLGRNPARDQWTAAVFSRFGYVPGVDLWKGFFHWAKADDLYWKWNASGGNMATLVSTDREQLQKKMADVFSGKAQLPGRLVRHPLQVLQAFSSAMEEGSRIGVMDRAGKQLDYSTKEGMLKGGFASRSSTIDFNRKGAIGKVINSYVAFWNPLVQGLDKTVRAFKNHPKSLILRAMLLITMPSLILAALNHDDERYQNLPQWQKDLFWVIPIGENLWFWPKPFELGILFGSVFERAAHYVLDKSKGKESSKAFNKLLATMARGATPGIIPTAILPVGEAYIDYSTFLDRPIVARGREELPPPQQYSRYTSDTLRILGRWLGKVPYVGDTMFASPEKLQHMVRGYTGGLGSMMLQGADVATRAALGSKVARPERQLADIPFVRGFVARYPTMSAEPIQEFYNNYSKLEKLRLGILQAKRIDAPELDELEDKGEKTGVNWRVNRQRKKVLKNELGAYHDDLTKNRKEIDAIYDDPNMTSKEKRVKIDEVILDSIKLSRDANQYYDDFIKEQRQNIK